MSAGRSGKASPMTPPTYWLSWMEVMGKVLSLRLDSTLKLFARDSCSPRYSTAVRAMASFSLGQAAARQTAMMPKIW